MELMDNTKSIDSDILGMTQLEQHLHQLQFWSPSTFPFLYRQTFVILILFSFQITWSELRTPKAKEARVGSLIWWLDFSD